MSRYSPLRSYRIASVIAVALGVFSVWVGLGWKPALLPAALFFLSALCFGYLASRPPIEIFSSHLAIGDREIPWTRIERVDRTRWTSPLVVRLTLSDDSRFRLVYPGNPDTARCLLRHLQRYARMAYIDGVPYEDYWGDSSDVESFEDCCASPWPRLLLEEDEAEVERLYRRLKAVGHLDSNRGNEGKQPMGRTD